MSFIYREDLGCSVYDPPLTGIELKTDYFDIRDECAKSLAHLHAVYVTRNNGRFGWVELVEIADTIGLPIKTTCQFLEKWGLIRDGLWEQKCLTSKQIRKAVDDYKNSQIC